MFKKENYIIILNICHLMKIIIYIYISQHEIPPAIDPMVDSWPLMGSPGPMLCIVGTYLIFVLKAGPKMMEKRPAFQLNIILTLYNAAQVIFSIWLTSLVNIIFGYLMRVIKRAWYIICSYLVHTFVPWKKHDFIDINYIQARYKT